ncbi:MAG: hypothetical protein DRQ51_03330 [Gammaproteobacteria bacterium]|nr:MAG: hypothetical protein DRQ51_03330 [Gammaproteobacteria bacterium]
MKTLAIIATTVFMIIAIVLFWYFNNQTLQKTQLNNEQLGYALISNTDETKKYTKPQITEYFWYGCEHCYNFLPKINQWKKTNHTKVDIELLPAAINPDMIDHARAYFAAVDLGVLDKFHDAMFDAIHKKKQKLYNMQDIANFAATLGIDKQKFIAAMQSPATEKRILRVNDMIVTQDITQTPALVLNNSYRINSNLAGGHNNMIRVLNNLIKEEN